MTQPDDHQAAADPQVVDATHADPPDAGPTQAAPPGIDVAPVTAWLADLLPSLRPPLTFARIGDGRSNLTYRVTDTTGAHWILRRPPLGKLLRGAHDMGREHRLIAALGPAGVAVPKPTASATTQPSRARRSP